MKSLSLVGAPVLLLVLSSNLFPQTAGQSDNKIAAQSADVAFRSGNALMGEKKYCEALSRYTEGLRSDPNDTALLYNGGVGGISVQTIR